MRLLSPLSMAFMASCAFLIFAGMLTLVHCDTTKWTMGEQIAFGLAHLIAWGVYGLFMGAFGGRKSQIMNF